MMRPFLIVAWVILASTTVAAAADDLKNPLLNGPTWADLKVDIVGDSEILDGGSLFDLEAPYRAHDAATVPIRVVQSVESDLHIVRLTLVVDENPAPVAATFEFGPALGRLDLETRVRVDRHSSIRAIAQTEDGRYWMAGRYVKGAGGCSAPALKDMQMALGTVGKIRVKLFEPADTVLQSASSRRQAQVMIRHPNYSGLQRNQITQLFIPAFFVHDLSIYLEKERVIHMEGGISISEDPTFRFHFDENETGRIIVEAEDTDGGKYRKVFPTDLPDSNS